MEFAKGPREIFFIINRSSACGTTIDGLLDFIMTERITPLEILKELPAFPVADIWATPRF
jgi:hypothetical protein